MADAHHTGGKFVFGNELLPSQLLQHGIGGGSTFDNHCCGRCHSNQLLGGLCHETAQTHGISLASCGLMTYGHDNGTMAAISLAQRFNPRFGGACTMKHLVGHGDFHRSYPLDIWFLQQRAALCAATNDDGVAFGGKGLAH